jgi:hypothetical protein
MEGGFKRPKAQARPFVPEVPQERVMIHRNVVVGVTLLALVALFSAFFWACILIMSVINPPDLFAGESGLSWIRVLLAIGGGTGLTKLTWVIADDAIES